MDAPLYRSRPDAFSMQPATNVRRKPVNDFIYLRGHRTRSSW
jgi:hypothetical protein